MYNLNDFITYILSCFIPSVKKNLIYQSKIKNESFLSDEDLKIFDLEDKKFWNIEKNSYLKQ